MQEPNQENTEDRIKNIARKIFSQKGFSGTTVRDIAEAANINIALLNYYFRSKERLFQEIFFESFVDLFKQEYQILEDPQLNLFEKVRCMIDLKFNMAVKNPDLPLFVLGELKQHIEANFFENSSIQHLACQSQIFEKQIHDAISNQLIRPVSSAELKILINSLVLFPFMAESMIQNFSKINPLDTFNYSTFTEGQPERIYTIITNYLTKF